MCPDVVDRLYDPVQVSVGRVKGLRDDIVPKGCQYALCSLRWATHNG